MGAALLYTKNTFKTPLNGIENPVLDKEGKKIYFPNKKKRKKKILCELGSSMAEINNQIYLQDKTEINTDLMESQIRLFANRKFYLAILLKQIYQIKCFIFNDFHPLYYHVLPWGIYGLKYTKSFCKIDRKKVRRISFES